MNDTVACGKDGTEALSDQAEIGRLLVRGGGECFEKTASGPRRWGVSVRRNTLARGA